ncbi:hypothetical protein GCM10027176_65590 [Actinoallomurus bryophytorum]|uniref:WXG100 family type VII secretion target n=1 Tax=Actinoallomurus bryophytorum TaxID=1490222 RepID=A0A543CHD5_9ACTN|nr:WXG100 family type VII secretion target [Actinoallomurus bryophytorum]TQL96337.1 WXG100 family type VII secretion target [Actinoallomurus bryophytorum]
MSTPSYIPESKIDGNTSQVSAIDPALAHKAVGRLDQSYNRIHQIKKTLEEQYLGLRKSWKSSSALAFDVKFAEFDEDILHVLHALETLRDKLKQGTLHYEKAIQETHETANRLQGLLNR